MQKYNLYESFRKIAILCKHHPKKTEIKNFILQGTPHTNLLDYHTDKGISNLHKEQTYAKALGTFVLDDINTGKPVPEDHESDLKTSYEKATESVDKKKIKQLEQELADKEHIKQALQKALELSQKEIEELEKKQPKIYEFQIDGKPKTTLGANGELVHKQLPEIIRLLASRNAIGYSEFLYIWGAPGAGKTHMGKQIAKALGVTCYSYPVGPTITEGKLVGFNNIATGSFIAGWLYKAYKEGGLVALDEIDLADAAVLGATNSIENDVYVFGNGERIERHKDFYLIAFANTQGTGSTKGFVRNILDAATRDRFTQVELEYDEDLEVQLYGNPKWSKYVQAVRKYVKDACNNSIYITPRASRKGAAYLNAGISPERVCDIVIFKSCNKDMKNAIISNVGKFTL